MSKVFFCLHNKLLVKSQKSLPILLTNGDNELLTCKHDLLGNNSGGGHIYANVLLIRLQLGRMKIAETSEKKIGETFKKKSKEKIEKTKIE